MAVSGTLQKMTSVWRRGEPVRYGLPLGEALLDVNAALGRQISLRFSGQILCQHCGASTSKSFSQGYCFKHARTLAACDLCLVKPETCHYHQGTCREPSWGEAHCLIPHTVYLAVSSGIKVGITRSGQKITRWIDQGAIKARPILQVDERRDAGLIEVALARHVPDKTNWRAMLKGEDVDVDLEAHARELLAHLPDGVEARVLTDAEDVEIRYPVLEYPEKVRALDLDKDPVIEGVLLGVRGQYLILDVGVLNVRKFTGYMVEVEGLSAVQGVLGEKAPAATSAEAGLLEFWPKAGELTRVGPYGPW